MFSYFFRTATEKKRDSYYKLYTKLNQRITEHDKYIGEVNTAYSSYVASIPHLSQIKIPSDDFEPKRVELTERLNKLYDLDKGKRLQLIIARDRALGRYEFYRQLAIEEAKDS